MGSFRLLILSSGRAGSSSLLNAFYYSLKNSTRYIEPLDTNAKIVTDKDKFQNYLLEIQNPRTKYYFEKNLVSSPNFLTFKERKHFYKKYIKYFDKVILLARRDVQKTIESFEFAVSNNIWHDAYNYKDSKNKNLNILHQETKKVKSSNELIEFLSTTYNIPITYYEDLFFNGKEFQQEFLKSLKLENLDYPDMFYRVINPKQKYRQDE